jgi:hypothetical protein
VAAENRVYVVRDDGPAQPPRQRRYKLYPYDFGVIEDARFRGYTGLAQVIIRVEGS